jgi:hypothetical protein
MGSTPETHSRLSESGADHGVWQRESYDFGLVACISRAVQWVAAVAISPDNPTYAHEASRVLETA